MPISSFAGKQTSPFVDPKMVEWEVMDLEAQLLKIKELEETPSKFRSKAVSESIERVKIWQTIELGLNKNKEAIDQLFGCGLNFQPS